MSIVKQHSSGYRVAVAFAAAIASISCTLGAFGAPARDGWRLGEMHTPRASHSAVIIGPNKLLVMGGEGAGSSQFGNAIKTAEIYNVKTNRWRYVGSMSQPRVGQIAVSLGNGRVLVAGGNDDDDKALSSAEIFSDETGKWKTAASLPKPAAEQNAIRLPNGNVLAIGGVVAGHVSRDVWMFNPKRNKWTWKASMKYASGGAEAVVLRDGNILVAGGTSPYAQLYQPSRNRWEVAGRPGERLFPALTRFGKSKVLMAGGNIIGGGCIAGVKIYLGGTKWVHGPAMESQRCAPFSTDLPNGNAIVGGGFFGVKTSASMQELDAKTGKWLHFPSLPAPRAAGTLNYIGGWLVASGGTAQGDEISTSEARRLRP